MIINLKNSLETVLTIYQNQIKQGVTLEKDIDTLEDINCFADELNQVWTNLIHNALQAMKHDNQILTIGIKKEDKYQIVSIGDNGDGIPEDIQDKIFNPFFTTKPAGEGSGLGLDIIRKIIDKHNGEINFDTKIREGTTFYVKLPI